MGGSGKSGWRWTDEQPGVVVIVTLILAFAFLFPQDACRGRVLVEPAERPAPMRGGDSTETDGTDPGAADSPNF